MNMNEQQYERIARWLDGEAVDLTAAEQAVAQELRRDEAAIAEAMTDVKTPLAAMARARRRMTAAAGGRRVLHLAFGAVGAAAAAAIVLAATMLWTPTPAAGPVAGNGGAANSADVPPEVWVGAMAPSAQMETMSALGDAIDRLASEVAISTPALPVDHEMDSIQDELNDFWQEDPQAWGSES